MMMSGRIRVLLADDHGVVRRGIREFLEEEGDIAVIAEAEDGLQAIALAPDAIRCGTAMSRSPMPTDLTNHLQIL